MEDGNYGKVTTLILAGGKLAGVTEATNVKNKGLLRIEGHEMIWYLLKTLKVVGINDNLIVLSCVNGECCEDEECRTNCDEKCNDFDLLEKMRKKLEQENIQFRYCFNKIKDSPLDALKEGLIKLNTEEKESEHVLVLCGDVPLIAHEEIKSVLQEHLQNNNDITIMCALRENPFGYGILTTDKTRKKNIKRIIEKDEVGERIFSLIPTLNDKKNLLKKINEVFRFKENIKVSGEEKKIFTHVGVMCFKRNLFTKEVLGKMEEWGMSGNRKDRADTKTVEIIKELFPNIKIKTCLIDSKHLSTAVGFNSFSEYIGISTRINCLTDKHYGRISRKLMKLLNEKCVNNSFDDKGLQKLIENFLKNYREPKKDLVEKMFDCIQLYEEEKNCKVRLKGYLKQYETFEPVLYKSASYREHLLHVFQVFLLGAYILDEMFTEDSERTNKLPSLQDVWYYASLFHDYCYPIERSSDTLQTILKDFLRRESLPGEKLKTIPIHFRFGDIGINFRDCIADFVNNGIERKGTGDAKLWLATLLLETLYTSYDHGVFSAIRLCDIIKDRETDIKRMIYRSIVAISVHTGKVCGEIKPYKEIKNLICDDLISRLLIFCDFLQEWGRENDSNSSQTRMAPQLEDLHINHNEKTITARLRYSDDKSWEQAKNKRKALEFIFEPHRESRWKFEVHLKLVKED